MTRQGFQDATKNGGVRRESQGRNLRSDSIHMNCQLCKWDGASCLAPFCPSRGAADSSRSSARLPSPDRHSRQTMEPKPTLEHVFLHSRVLLS